MKKLSFKTVDEYIALMPEQIRPVLEQMRAVIKETVPDAEESIAYQMPAYKYNGPLVYFAAYSKHIGFYPTGSGISQFAHKFSGLKFSKGAVQFPIDKPLPTDLIREITAFRFNENKLKVYKRSTDKIK